MLPGTATMELIQGYAYEVVSTFAALIWGSAISSVYLVTITRFWQLELSMMDTASLQDMAL
jgi:hypothetical protein